MGARSGGNTSRGFTAALLLAAAACVGPNDASPGPAGENDPSPAPAYSAPNSGPSSGPNAPDDGPMRLEPPVPAPDFALPMTRSLTARTTGKAEATVGEVFALSENFGQWIVLHISPRADTPDCACDATAFTDHLWRFGDLDALVVCVGAAPIEDARRYVTKYGLRAPMVADPGLEVIERYGALDPKAADPVVRTTVVIDPEGRMRARFDRVENPHHIDAVLEALLELR